MPRPSLREVRFQSQLKSMERPSKISEKHLRLMPPVLALSRNSRMLRRSLRQRLGRTTTKFSVLQTEIVHTTILRKHTKSLLSNGIQIKTLGQRNNRKKLRRCSKKLMRP